MRNRPDIKERSTPPCSVLGREWSASYYADSWEAVLTRTALPVHELYLGIFDHHPWWAKWLLVIRTKIVSVFGLKGPAFADFKRTTIKDSYAVGEKIGRFTLLFQTDNELIAGGNDKHLEFRVSVLKMREDGMNKVVLSTIVNPHNLFGKVYLFFILPFHRFGVKMILANAVAAKRV